MQRVILAVLTGAAIAVGAPALLAQGGAGTFKVEGSKKLLAEAKITPDSAAAIARARMPGETVTQAKIGHARKQLAYTVSLEKSGSKGVDRVWVNAATGDVIMSKHYGGISGRIRHAHQSHELNEAKKDSTKRATP